MKSNLLLHDDVQVSSGLRFANFIIDTIAFYVILIVVIFCSGLFTAFDIYGPSNFFLELSDIGYRILGVAFMFAYYFIFEVTTQRTLGKYLTGFLGSNRGWHDTASNTFVVKAKKWKELSSLEDSFDEIGEPQTDSNPTPVV